MKRQKRITVCLVFLAVSANSFFYLSFVLLPNVIFISVIDSVAFLYLAFELLLHLLPNKTAKGKRTRTLTAESWPALFQNFDVSLRFARRLIFNFVYRSKVIMLFPFRE